MTTKPKMKGIFKGFKYISQIFDEDKEDEIQIGFPTDVKHVAHIGWDGPTIDSPSWMKEFNASTGFQSAPLGPPTGGDGPVGEPEIKWVSEDSNARRGSKPPLDSPGRDLPDVPRSSRRHHSSSSSAAAASSESSPRKKDPSTRPRRRTHSKDSSEGGSVRSNREACDSPSRGVPADPARRSRRKKSRELGGDGSNRSRPKPAPTADALPLSPSSNNINDNNNKEEESIDKNNPPAEPVPST